MRRMIWGAIAGALLVTLVAFAAWFLLSYPGEPALGAEGEAINEVGIDMDVSGNSSATAMYTGWPPELPIVSPGGYTLGSIERCVRVDGSGGFDAVKDLEIDVYADYVPFDEPPIGWGFQLIYDDDPGDSTAEEIHVVNPVSGKHILSFMDYDGDGYYSEDGPPFIGADGVDNDGDTLTDEDTENSVSELFDARPDSDGTFGAGAGLLNPDEVGGAGVVNDGCPADGAAEGGLVAPKAGSCREVGSQCNDGIDSDVVCEGGTPDGVIDDGCSQCGNDIDDDGDGFVNDGCPAIGAAEAGAQCTESPGSALDDDHDAAAVIMRIALDVNLDFTGVIPLSLSGFSLKDDENVAMTVNNLYGAQLAINTPCPAPPVTADLEKVSLNVMPDTGTYPDWPAIPVSEDAWFQLEEVLQNNGPENLVDAWTVITCTPPESLGGGEAGGECSYHCQGGEIITNTIQMDADEDCGGDPNADENGGAGTCDDGIDNDNDGTCDHGGGVCSTVVEPDCAADAEWFATWPDILDVHKQVVLASGPKNLHLQDPVIRTPDPLEMAAGAVVSSRWHELYPTYSTMWHAKAIDDNGDTILSASDQILLEDLVYDPTASEDGGAVDTCSNATDDGGDTHADELDSDCYVTGGVGEADFHVDEVTATIYLDTPEPMYLELEAGDMAVCLPDPTNVACTWHEKWPEYSRICAVTGWADGGDGQVSTSDTLQLECDGVPITDAHVHHVTLDIWVTGKPVTLLEDWDVHCLEPSTHTWQFHNEVYAKDPSIIDPVPGNNSKDLDLVLNCLAEADVTISDQYFDPSPPTEITVGQDYDVTLHKVLLNTGPYGPVDVDITTDVPEPANCTATPSAVSPPPPVSLAVGSPVDVYEDWTINCSQEGIDVTFPFDNSIALVFLEHLSEGADTNPNSDTTNLIVDVTSVLGDVDCDTAWTSVDALFVLQYVVGLRTAGNQCPLVGTTLYLPAADVDSDGDEDVIDALFILQCVVGGIPNPLCPGA